MTSSDRSRPASQSEVQTELLEELKVVSERVRSVINGALEAGSPKILYKAAGHLTKAGGKMLRPYLALKSCEIVGGKAEDAIPAAAAMELLHTFTLIHDDIIDRDEVRRGVPTVHSLWGTPIAIVAGDLLFAKVNAIVTSRTDPTRVSPQRIVRVLDTISDATINICEGQILDMLYPSMEGVSEEDYMAMIGKKTSYLFKATAEAGGIIGGGSEAEITSLGRFAYSVGLAFQITDDVLGLTSSLEKLGKPVGSDLREGKKTLPLLYTLSHSRTEERNKIQGLLKGTPNPEEIMQLRDLIASTGAVKYASNKAREYLEGGLRELEIFPKNAAKLALRRFSSFLVDRGF